MEKVEAKATVPIVYFRRVLRVMEKDVGPQQVKKIGKGRCGANCR